MANDIKQYVGKIFGFWTVQDTFYKQVNFKKVKRRIYCKCICVCGNRRDIRLDALKSGQNKSCGCKTERKVKHGLSKTRLYKIWVAMKQRCNNQNSKEYYCYGGRGIKVCEEWNDFITFEKWALKNGYSDKLTIDRINNDLGYFPKNCRWITKQEQLKNTSRNIFITFNGETKCVQDWCRQFGLKNNVVCKRFRYGLPLELVFSKKKLTGMNFKNFKMKGE